MTKETAQKDWHHVITMEETGELTRKFHIVYDSVGVAMAMDKAANNLKKNVVLKGFRKGKAPAYMIKKMLAKDVKEMASFLLSQEGFLNACFENKIQPMGKPNVLSSSFEKDGQFICDVEVNIRPTIVPSGYVGIALNKPEFDVEGLAQQELENLRNYWAKKVEKEILENGNIAVVDFCVKHEEEELNSVSDQQFEIMESQEPPIGKNLIGLKAGDSIEEQMEIPEGFGEASGKMGTIYITIKSVLEKVPLTDEEISKELQVKDFESDKEKIQASVKQHVAIKEKENLEEQVIDRLLELHEFSVPENWVNDEYKFVKQGLQLEAVDEELDQKLKELALRNVKRSFILDAIGDEEKVQVSEEELNQFIKQEADKSNVSQLKVKQELKKNKMWDTVVMSIRQRKILDLVLSQAQLVEESQDSMVESFDIPENPMG